MAVESIFEHEYPLSHFRSLPEASFDELDRVRALADDPTGLVQSRVLARVRAGALEYPIISLSIGADDPSLPVFGLFGGVHGLEKVGSHVVITYLESLAARLRWDGALRAQFNRARLVSIPVVNPAGMHLGTRSNPNGIDLMRNAPQDAEGVAPRLLGGHRISPLLPWYRGQKGQAMEREARALCDFVRAEMFNAPAALALDVHSGFGMRDRLWYPYAKRHGAFPAEAQARAIGRLLDQSHPHHIYQIEPQSAQYTTHGDLWDFLFDDHRATAHREGRHLLPWTLEMGSWMWVRKNPIQLLSALGPFNPTVKHRHDRTMRRHSTLMEFFLSLVQNPAAWTTQ